MHTIRLYGCASPDAGGCVLCWTVLSNDVVPSADLRWSLRNVFWGDGVGRTPHRDGLDRVHFHSGKGYRIHRGFSQSSFCGGGVCIVTGQEQRGFSGQPTPGGSDFVSHGCYLVNLPHIFQLPV